MSKALYLDDMEKKEFDAQVTTVSKGKFIVLDQTAFYPKSGGVSYDTGTLIRKSDQKEFQVVYTGKFSGKISHEVDKEGLQEGDEVHGILDWNRRLELMRYHTAAHVISGVFYNEGKIKVTGNKLEPGKGRIDFNIDEFDREIFENYIAKSNAIIDKDLPIETYYISREELEQNSSLMKLAMGLPQSIKKIRIVDIKGFDRQPDGGCHVSHLKQIGRIKITDIKNKGKDNRRLYFSLD